MKSKYKGVLWQSNVLKWKANIQYKGEKRYLGTFSSERDAAIAYDKECISLGLPPVNILKPLNK